MNPMEANPSEQIAQVVRDTLKDELRAQTAKQRRPARLYAGASAAALYAGAAFTAFLVLVLHLALPAWAAALVAGILLAGLAVVLKQAARPGTGSAAPAALSGAGQGMSGAGQGTPAAPVATPPGGDVPLGVPPVPPTPPTAGEVPGRPS
ncbi:phage holin family protein [Streptomyces hypolithicus]